MSDICVVHLVRKRNGLEPFEKFLDSYLNHKAGIEHTLLIIYKGFNGKSDVAAYEKLLAGIPHTYLFLSDIGFDLRPYFIAARKSESKYLCFLNSFSIILADDWLLKLHTHIKKPGVGLVGATGSWGSICPGPFTKKKNIPLWKKLLRPLAWRLARIYLSRYFHNFHNFPNAHIRTNGFMVARDNMIKIKSRLLLFKMDAYILESGKKSITRQIQGLGLSTFVVGKDGIAYDINDWQVSDTFWTPTQSNLLIADNQTRKFDAADSETRSFLENFAWGGVFDQQQSKKSRSP
jgi:hypothetical protein